MKRYSILSVDSNPDYLFLAPITSAFWVDLGYTPFIIVVDESFKEDIKSLVFENTINAGAQIEEVKNIKGYRTCNVAQVSRLYAAASNHFNPDDYLMTDDIDKIPVDYMWFNCQNLKKQIHIYDPDELNYKRLKMGNIGMKSEVWKEIIGITNGGIIDNVKLCFDKNLSKDSTWEKGWNLDEWILTNSVFNSKYYPDECQMIERGGNNLGLRNYRIDRGAWTQTYNYCKSTKIIDIHIHRKPWAGQVWEDLVSIMKDTFTKEKVDSLIQYKEQFVRLLGDD